MIVEPISSKYTSFLTDESHVKGDCEEIIFPQTQDDILQCIKLALKDNKRITLQGARTGLNGACVPKGQTVINLSKMNEIGEVEQCEDGAEIFVQCGAALGDISKLAQS